MKLTHRCLMALVMPLLTLAAQSAQALVITLDFETAATGSGLLGGPLVTPAGTITLSNATLIVPTSAGPGNGVFHDANANPGFAVFSFDFDVVSLSFDYSGQGAGVFIGEALNAANGVVDSFFDPDTLSIEGNQTLLGGGIRSFRFADDPFGPGGGSLTSIDNLVLTVANVPEPSSLALLGLSLAGLAATRRRKQ